ncbi:GntR family transcriptional regulator [Limibaculum sp. FT325]|uniref:FadR/GntR family transcriptional regulator n=1 Tax=Thermohalobaculum sediminis TaxID=2939436 RepID=UPI0020C0B24F|nr:GntR family transcriptional regulator [Limibaculum sediminis]MCL5777917.1 GntR family transcriptional regulator [Limibaculum sediminis]
MVPSSALSTIRARKLMAGSFRVRAGGYGAGESDFKLSNIRKFGKLHSRTKRRNEVRMSDERGKGMGAGEAIAAQIRALILEGRIGVDERLPGEQDLAARFGVSRPTVREALKTLAAQNLIRTRRGSSGGSFVNRYGIEEAQDQLVSTAIMLMGLNRIAPEAVTEARLTFLSAIAPLACARRTAQQVAAMRAEIDVQRNPATTDEEFCASDVRFHRTLANAAGNPLIAFQMAAVIEAMQPLLNMLTWRGRDRAEIAARHARIVSTLERRDATALINELAQLSDYTGRLVAEAQAIAGRSRVS